MMEYFPLYTQWFLQFKHMNIMWSSFLLEYEQNCKCPWLIKINYSISTTELYYMK